MPKPTIPEVAPLIAAYYAKPGNEVGGSLHIVLDDGNIERYHVEFCRRYAEEHNDPDGAALAEILLQCSITQRKKLCVHPGYRAWLDDANGHLPRGEGPRWKVVQKLKFETAYSGDIRIYIVDALGHKHYFYFMKGSSQDLT